MFVLGCTTQRRSTIPPELGHIFCTELVPGNTMYCARVWIRVGAKGSTDFFSTVLLCAPTRRKQIRYNMLPKRGADERVVIRGGARGILLHGGLRAPTRQTHMVQYRVDVLRALPTAVAAAARPLMAHCHRARGD